MDSKMEIESVLCKYSVKEEGTDGDNIKRENDEIKKEFEAETCHSWDQVWDGTEQNTEESPHIDIKEIKLGQSEVEFKLESISDEEVNEDEIDAPNSISLEGFNGKQEDTVHKKNEPKTRKARSRRNLFECSTCGRTYSTEINLRQHMVLHLAPKNRPTYDCDMCDFKCIYIATFKKHKLKHANRPNWTGKLKNKYNTCDKCAYPARNYSELKIHEQTHKARSNGVQCPICAHMFVRKSCLKRHMVLHMDPKDRPTYDCDICTFKSISKDSLTRHKSRHMIQASPESAELKKRPKKLKCDKCSYWTEESYSKLRRHEQTHKTRSDRDLFECATCGLKCVRKRSLEQHMVLHMDPKDRPTYDCDMCNFKTIYKFGIKDHKLRHMILVNSESAHSKERPKKFKCDKCSYRARYPSELRIHEQTHKARSDRDLLECANCGQKYITKGALEHHMLLHMDPKDWPTYDCDLCDHKTTVKSRLKVHRLRHANRAESAFVESKNKIEEMQT